MPVEDAQYPVNLRLQGKSVLLVGAGPVAAQKLRGLLDGGADRITVVAPEVVDEIVTLADGHAGVTVEQRPYRSGEAQAYRLVVTATSEPEVNAQVASDADASGVWVNSADDPVNCTFTLPARVRRGRLLVTVSTRGFSPAISTWIRGRLEEEFDESYDVLIGLLSEAREQIRASGRSTEGLNWQSALQSGMLELVREGRVAEARELLNQCLSSSSE